MHFKIHRRLIKLHFRFFKLALRPSNFASIDLTGLHFGKHSLEKSFVDCNVDLAMLQKDLIADHLEQDLDWIENFLFLLEPNIFVKN